jgi:hypothetical protein
MKMTRRSGSPSAEPSCHGPQPRTFSLDHDLVSNSVLLAHPAATASSLIREVHHQAKPREPRREEAEMTSPSRQEVGWNGILIL